MNNKNIFEYQKNFVLSFSLFLIIGWLFFPLLAKAAEPEVKVKDEAYAAKFVSQSEKDPIQMEAGSSKDIIIKFKNAGTVAWNNSGSRYISAYTMEPRDRKSEFNGSNWNSSKQTGKMVGTVKPGEIGELKINLKAPDKPGEYLEKFYLAAENHSWMKGGYFYLKIKVVERKKIITDSVLPAVPQAEPAGYGIARTMLSKKTVSAPGGELVKVIIGFQNIGEKEWSNFKLINKSDSAISIADSTWKNKNEITEWSEKIPKDKLIRKEFYFRTPPKIGNYQANFQMQIDGYDLPKTIFLIEVIVTVDAPANYQSPSSDSEISKQTPRLTEEPRIRVGLWKPESFVQFRSYEDNYNVYDGPTLMGVLPMKKLGVFNYTDGYYTFKGGEMDFKSKNYIRLSPINNPRSVFVLQNYDRNISWKGPNNFNQYRGAVEYRLTQNGTMYVINDLLFEDYIAGIGENSAGAPYEYLKAQMVAARSYAYYIQNTSKHDERNFDVVATTGDQLYLGVISEGLLPRVVQAANETAGQMATYDNEIVITPYFGNSNGKTKSWTSVWGGANKPWLVPVAAEYDSGRKQNGHGVGMSQLDAAQRAQKEGSSYLDLLKHYYTGVEIQRIY